MVDRFDWSEEGMEGSSTGEYVEHTDYEDLQSEYDNLQTELEELQGKYDDLIREINDFAREVERVKDGY